jgi:hypothetical protein
MTAYAGQPKSSLKDGDGPGRDIFAREEFCAYLQGRVGGTHADDVGQQAEAIDIPGPGGERLHRKDVARGAAVTRKPGWSNTRRLPGSSLPEI